MFNRAIFYSLLVTRYYIAISDFITKPNCYDIISTVLSTYSGISPYSGFVSPYFASFVTPATYIFVFVDLCSFSGFYCFDFAFVGSIGWSFSISFLLKFDFQNITIESLPPVAKKSPWVEKQPALVLPLWPYRVYSREAFLVSHILIFPSKEVDRSLSYLEWKSMAVTGSPWAS